ncbi:MAG: hypothetical protein JWQ38_1878 [Flavipsychrobacter sp.]|nr:hypothetical protein [Flavipsychrobacter sp.]
MKKNLLRTRALSIVLVFLCTAQAIAQDIVKITHTYYTSYFSTREHIPLLVQYTLTDDMVNCSPETKVPRSVGKFKADPLEPELTNLAKDYLRSGYDKGHNMSAADNGCNVTGMQECFYFSNMTPQPHFFNAGVWSKLERQERNEAIEHGKIMVSIGSVGKAGAIGPDSVIVPKYMWKVIYYPRQKIYECYIFPNSDEASRPLEEYLTTLDVLQAHADVTFHNGVATLND